MKSIASFYSVIFVMRGSRWLYYRQRKAANACYIRRHSSHNFHREQRPNIVTHLGALTDALASVPLPRIL